MSLLAVHALSSLHLYLSLSSLVQPDWHLLIRSLSRRPLLLTQPLISDFLYLHLPGPQRGYEALAHLCYVPRV